MTPRATWRARWCSASTPWPGWCSRSRCCTGARRRHDHAGEPARDQARAQARDQARDQARAQELALAEERGAARVRAQVRAVIDERRRVVRVGEQQVEVVEVAELDQVFPD